MSSRNAMNNERRTVASTAPGPWFGFADGAAGGSKRARVYFTHTDGGASS